MKSRILTVACVMLLGSIGAYVAYKSIKYREIDDLTPLRSQSPLLSSSESVADQPKVGEQPAGSQGPNIATWTSPNQVESPSIKNASLPAAAPLKPIVENYPVDPLRGNEELQKTENTFQAHAELRRTDLSDPNSPVNRRVMSQMVAKALKNSSEASNGMPSSNSPLKQ